MKIDKLLEISSWPAWYWLLEMNGLAPDITAAELVRHGVLRLTFAEG